MKWYFDSDDRKDQLRESLQRWHLTPFAQGRAAAGVGVDCVRFVREVYRECGVDVACAAEIPCYSLSWGVHQEGSQVLAWLLENPQARRRLARIDPEDPMMPGDLVAVRSTRALKSVHHAGIVGSEGETMWHVDIPAGVQVLQWWAIRQHVRIAALFRLREEEPFV